jgi:ATP-binding protein involved in chromosome partitioning
MGLPIQKTKIPGVKTILGVLGAKGGSGKTFVTANLGLTLAKFGNKVGILDADISCPDMFKMLGITQHITPTADNKIIPIEKFGVKTISMAGLCATEDEPVAYRGPILSKIIQKFLKETLWGELDILLIDFPTGTSDAEITILQNFSVDGVLLVITPQSLAITDGRRVANTLTLLKVPLFGIVENMRGDVFGEGGGGKLSESLRIPLLGSIPLRKQIVHLCDSGEPAVFHMEELEMIFSKMARQVVEKILVES